MRLSVTRLSATGAARRAGAGDPPPPLSAPVNTAAPSIAGSPVVYQTLTASSGAWTGYPDPTFAYQWRRNGANIGGATAQTYTLQEADHTATITVSVTATNSQGSASAVSAGVVVAAAAPANTVAPMASGSTGLGDVLAATSGTWSGFPAPAIAYQWTRNGVDIAGATGSTYTVAVADSGASIACRVTATNPGGSVAQTSNSIAAQTFTAPVIAGAPSISGTAEVGQALTATPSSATGNPTPARTWQWLRDGASISGATGSTYTLVSADGGTDISVRQTETNALGFDAEVSAVVEVSAGASFSPASLFGAADRGGIYDATTNANMAQLSGGTGAVAVGDPVGYLADLGPIGRPALQATAASRPVFSGSPKTLGSELVTNGRFATDTDWTKGTGWTINTTTGRAEKVAGTASVLSIPVSVTPGRLYFLPFYITRTAGTVTARLTGGTTVAGTARSYVGSYLEVFYALTGNVTLEFSADAAFAGSVGNVSMKEVTGFSNPGLRLDGTDDALQTANVDLSNSDKLTLIVGFQAGQSAAAQVPLAFGNYPANLAGSGEILLSGAWQARLRGATGSAISSAPSADSLLASNFQDNVQVAEFDLAGAAIADQTRIGLRGVFPANTPSGALSGGGVLANSAITLGRAFSTFRLNGVLRRALVINRKLTTEELANARAWVGQGSVIAAVLGDSTVANLGSPQGQPQAMKISSLVGGMVCNGGDLAKSGDRIANQKTAWQALTNKGALQVVIVQIGLNDVKGRVGENQATTAQVIADLQDLVNTVNADKPAGCRVYVSGLIPCRTWLNASTNPTAAYSAWQAVNEAIAGNGATPITGVDGRITSHVAALAGVNDILHPNFDMDGVHENNEARFIVAQAWRARLEADGLL